MRTTVTRYIYDNEDILLELDGSNNITARYTHGPGIDEPLILEKSGQSFFYHADGLGSNTEITNSSGTVVQAYTYSSFGKIESQLDPNFVQPYAFTAREFDPETGMYFYRARYYDPAVGRFNQEDPIRFLGGMNFYLYVGNNPVDAVDPWGLLNPTKALVAAGNALNAGRLYASGGAKILAAAGVSATGIGAPAGAGIAALGFWNINSGGAAHRRAIQQWNEAFQENWSDASWRNLFGVLPFGERFDDPCEPTFREFLRQQYDRALGSPSELWEFIREIGTFF